jgi:cation-transporting ATPase 13A3/4/5
MRRFDFTSKLMRMSVIVKNQLDGVYRSYIKGSPEKIKELSIPTSVPKNYDSIQMKYT